MGTFKSYLSGFLISVVLTLTAYYFVNQHVVSGHITYSHEFLIVLVMILAVIQLFVQLVFFLHFNKGSDRRWNLISLFSTFTIILILVVGSLWIMNHLNYNMTPGQMNAALLKNEGIK